METDKKIPIVCFCEKSLFDAPFGVYFLGRKVEKTWISHKETRKYLDQEM
tara:strand:+ start:238 stop:387 length:150 start_codon:yes stop_codon:yes gene_type:complete